MPIPKITADQFTTNLNLGIQNRDAGADVEIGPIPDIVIQPTAQVLENQNDRIRQVSQLILLDQSATFTDTDVDDFVFNEDMLRNTGGRSTSTVTFSRATIPTIDIPVQRGFPIATMPDEATGQTVVFVTTEQKTMVAAQAASYFNITTGRYELEVAVQATISGKIGEVGPNRINRPLRPLAGFDTVTNVGRTSTVVDREINDRLIERYKIAIQGTQLATNKGLRLFIVSQYIDVGGVLIINSGDPLVTRTGTSGNAVDVFITGSQASSRVDNQIFLGVGQLIILDHQPVTQVVSVINPIGPVTYVVGTDYEIVSDTSGVSGSNQAQDAIRFIPGGTFPAVGDTIQITYTQNSLVDTIQNDFTDPDRIVGGQDILIRTGTQIDITLAARLIVLGGFSWSTVATAVTNAILNWINALSLDADVEQSDIQGEVRNISGVDNFIFTKLDVKPGTGNADVVVGKNEFARIDVTDIALTT